MRKDAYDQACFKKKVNMALCKAKRLGKEYIEWAIQPRYIEFINEHYNAQLVQYEIDRYSFHIHFNPRNCTSKIVNKIYSMNGRYVRAKLDNQQISECKRVGLKVKPCVFRIFVS